MKKRVEDLLGKMTLREKVGQLNQHLYGFDSYVRISDAEIEPSDSFKKEVDKWSGLGFLYGLHRSDPWSKKDYKTGLTGSLSPKATNMLQRYVLEHSRLEIPMAITSECPHGNQILDGYLYPVNLAVGATFNPELLEKAAYRAGQQLKELGVSLALISLLDVCRDPRWGRSEECFSEDPYLASMFAAAGVRGMQKSGTFAVAKHLAGQGQTTGGVNASSALIGWNELREIHLKTMEACAKENCAAVMAAYNDVDGVPCHANKALLTDYLRKELSFDGLIMADGVAIDRLDVLTGDNEASAELALKSGVEVSLWDVAFTKLEQVIQKSGDKELEEALDRAVYRVIAFKEKAGLFDHPFVEESDKYVQLGRYDGEDDPSYQLSLESAVLLKNQETLPLGGGRAHCYLDNGNEGNCGDGHEGVKWNNLLVLGDMADDIYRQLGDYTPYVRDFREKCMSPVLEGDGDACRPYTVLRGIKEIDRNVQFLGNDEFIKASKNGKVGDISFDADTIICVIGGSSSRFAGARFDSNGAAIVGEDGAKEDEYRETLTGSVDGTDDCNRTIMDCGEGVDNAILSLPSQDLEMLRLARKSFPDKKIVTVVIAGRAYVIKEVMDLSDAVLYCFYPGPMGGKAIADIIFGRTVPSGNLPVSLPRSAAQLPCYYNYRASYEGMKYCDLEEKSLLPFGFGLTYGEFKYEDLELKDGKIRLTVSCSWKQDATCTIMLFVRRKTGSTFPRVRELVDFKKISVHNGGRTSVEFDVPKDFSGDLFVADGRGDIVKFTV